MADPTRRLAPVVRVARAKLNLTLAVGGRRPDGYHELHSVAVPLDLADRLSLAVQPAAPADSLSVTGRDAGPVESNLVLGALAAVRAAALPVAGGPRGVPPLAARLDKRIPVAAGLGGGSSDAAAAIDGALEAWAVDLPAAERLAVAARIGSDVPFCLTGGAAVVEGVGEQVAALPTPRGDPPGVLLVTPALAVRTADAYAALDAVRARPSGATRLTSAHLAAELRAGLRGSDLVARAGVLASANDLLAATAALVPALVPFRRALMRRLGRPIGQSGSGPTLWALYPSAEAADDAARAVRAALADGSLEAPGDGPPFVEATSIAPGPRTDQEDRPA